MVGTHEMISGCLTRGIRRVGCVLRVLAKRRIVRTERTVYLVGRHVMEAVFVSAALFQPHLARGLEQRVGAHYVGFDEGGWTGYRAVDVRFRGEMHQRVNRLLAQKI